MQKLNDDIQALTQQQNTLKQIQKLQDKHAKLDEFYQKNAKVFVPLTKMVVSVSKIWIM